MKQTDLDICNTLTLSLQHIFELLLFCGINHALFNCGLGVWLQDVHPVGFSPVSRIVLSNRHNNAISQTQPQQSDSKAAPPDKPAATRQQAVPCAVQAMHIDVQEAAKERVAAQKTMHDENMAMFGQFLV